MTIRSFMKGDPMGLFSRKSKSASWHQSNGDPSSVFIGRKFRSSASVQESLDAYSIVIRECYRATSPVYDVGWRTPAAASTFESSQGAPSLVPPARIVATDLADGGCIYLALWDGMVSYGGGSGQGGPPREMWFVPPGFDTSPIPIAGAWKMRDGSLSSIGWVESPLWGVVNE